MSDNQSIIYHDPRKEPFEIFGLYDPLAEGQYKRLPTEIATLTSETVTRLHTNTAGGRIRFKTDSEKLFVKVVGDLLPQKRHCTPVMEYGFDCYIKTACGYRYGGMLVGKFEERAEFIATVNLPEGENEITLNMPLCGNVHSVEIGLTVGASVLKHSDYRLNTPIVFYGSSITQGYCASRPGKSYEAIISNRYDVNYVNLGFASGAKGEKVMAEYMAGLKMSAFVCDYDHNAPNPDHLRATHYALYETIRAKHPDIPYIMITRPGFLYKQDSVARRAVIMESYLKALNSGDRNVWFVDGAGFFSRMPLGEWSVDRTHPNDDGFVAMADTIGEVICQLIDKGDIHD